MSAISIVGDNAHVHLTGTGRSGPVSSQLLTGPVDM